MAGTRRKDREPTGPGDSDMAIVVKTVQQVGELIGTVNQMNERLGEVIQGQQLNAQALEQSAVDNEQAHAALNQRLSEMGARIDGLHESVGTLQEEVRALRSGGKDKPPGGGEVVKAWGEFFAFLWKWVPKIAAALAAVGVAWAAWRSGGGDTP